MFKKKRAKRNVKITEKSNLNKVSQKHLDYYNEEIKDLKNRPATPEEAHVVFEVSKSKKK